MSREAKNLSSPGKAVPTRIATMGGRRVAIEEAVMRREDIVVRWAGLGGGARAAAGAPADRARPAGRGPGPAAAVAALRARDPRTGHGRVEQIAFLDKTVA